MSYVLGAAVGIAVGFIVGYLKYVLLWKRYSYVGDDAHTVKASKVYLYQIISFIADVLTLLIIFILKNELPFYWRTCLLGAGTGLTVASILFAFLQKRSMDKQKKKEADEK